MFTVGVDVTCFFHPQEEEPVKSLMAVEVKPAALPGREVGREHRPLQPWDQAKGPCEGQSDSGSVCHKDKVPSVASSRDSGTFVVGALLRDTPPSLAEEGVSSLGLHVFAASKSCSSFLQCFPRLLHFPFCPFISMTALVIMLEECVVDTIIV